ncbi:hypothetical protein SPRG_20099 [Saprolegnia parasitica CBS 223.65]|uniref:C2H2-type domain-containing protein n=1 Tax=Saprolegnia parasitica (strain CBS 223.65) TaxID=695850 RepID=A0A067CII0_SAPPC|nr:hypothetical protein SPRG_20099 [Saprolegnia parasitica CBS 223.65]KDO28995.1 hypothetical protein SPRG_20099 [Saprolegnia parasitica CBS 223.65]|eukprot:XP_012200325.1 hypothetical protein SPRG_20099 [Saprolegnia parasitica CBS 223.65]
MGCRVLTVGDGDLSYSRCLLDPENWRDLSIDAPTIDLTASTFDSLLALEDKYAMARSNIEALSAGSAAVTATVLHDIDATNLAAFENDEADHFDRIVFNHPHSGVEDVHRHRRLLSHFFHAALRVLRPGGKVFVTLARDQPKRWEILKRADALDLVCCKHELWTEPRGYQRKRHQSDKSFHRILLHGEKLEQQSTIFGFGRRRDGTAPLAHSPVPSALPQSNGMACDDPACGGKRFATAQGLKTHLRMVHELGIKKRKRGKDADDDVCCAHCNGRQFQDAEALQQHMLAKHGKDSRIRPDWYGHAPPTTEEKEEPSAQCPICMELFPSATALSAHLSTLQPVAAAKWTCTSCEKTFEEQRALRQHQNFCTNDT